MIQFEDVFLLGDMRITEVAVAQVTAKDLYRRAFVPVRVTLALRGFRA